MRMNAPSRLVVITLSLLVALVVPTASALAADQDAGPGSTSGAGSDPGPRNPGTVTLAATPGAVDFGGAVSLTGGITPVAAGESVVIKNGGGTTVATATTDALGAYATSFVPHSNMVLHAEWGPDSSLPVDVHVRAIVTVHIDDVRLFGRAKVTGTVVPASPGAPVAIDLVVKGDGVVGSHSVSQDAGGAFIWRTRTLDAPGDYQAVATASVPGLDDGSETSAWRDTPLPNLHPGSHGVMVGLLEKRLVDLGYHLVKINNGYDYRTADAVLAFRKAQGMNRTDTVDAAVWRALADPRSAQARFNLNGRHIEVDLSRQVLFVVDDGDVTYVLHVSTGKPTTPTPPGHYRIRFKRPGMNASGMYYSSYFLEHFAIHGYASVPTYNASHGCVRVPMWTAKWIYGIAKVGMRMMIYG